MYFFRIKTLQKLLIAPKLSSGFNLLWCFHALFLRPTDILINNVWWRTFQISHLFVLRLQLGLPAAPGSVGAVDVGVHRVVVVAKRVDPDVGGADEN